MTADDDEGGGKVEMSQKSALHLFCAGNPAARRLLRVRILTTMRVAGK